jgi:hypothetical protein
MKDMRGKAIKKGSIIVYPNRQGSNMWMTEAVVEEVDNKSWRLHVQPKAYPNEVRHSLKKVYLTAIDRVVVVG